MRWTAILMLPALWLAGPLAAAAATEQAQARVTPWSGPWWSMQKAWMSKGYVSDDTAPLRKHDQVTGADAAGWEDKNHAGPDMPKWYGHCHAWAAAALTEPEPREVVRYRGVRFRVGDLKALLTEGHFGDQATTTTGVAASPWSR